MTTATTTSLLEKTQQILEMAKVYSNNRVISVLEGGYHVEAVGDAVLSHVLALSQEP